MTGSKPTTLTDEYLIETYKSTQDGQILATLLHRHSKAISSIASANLGPMYQSEVDDVLQQVKIKLITNLNNFNNKSQFTTWLYSVVRNTSLDHIRKNAKHLASIPIDECEEPSSEMLEELKPLSSVLNEYVERLPLQYRTVLYMHYWQGLTQLEIAEYLQVNQGTVKGYLHRIKKQLSQQIDYK